MTTTLIHVALGGALGASLRYLIAGSVGFPYGTLTVNIIGSFIMGALFETLEARGFGHLSPLVMTGVLGGFTTFSAFSLDVLRLIETGRGEEAVLYAGGSVTLSLAAVFAGVWMMRGVLT